MSSGSLRGHRRRSSSSLVAVLVAKAAWMVLVTFKVEDALQDITLVLVVIQTQKRRKKRKKQEENISAGVLDKD